MLGVVPATRSARSFPDLLGRMERECSPGTPTRVPPWLPGARSSGPSSAWTRSSPHRPVDARRDGAAQAASTRRRSREGASASWRRSPAAIAAIRGTAAPGRLNAALVLAAGDHGYARRGVSAYPQEVTGQMLAAFAAGGAAIDVLARETGLRLVVVDAGVVEPIAHPEIRSLRLGAGTADATAGRR